MRRLRVREALTDLIEYELQLPATKTGEKLAKTIGRILKHTYSAKRLRVQHSKDLLIMTARVDSAHLNAIRGAVQMTMMARGVKGNVHYGKADDGEPKQDPDAKLCPAG